MPLRDPFVMIVTDRDTKTFSVEGPMHDDTAWTDAVCTAQAVKRQVNGHTPSGNARSNVELAAQVYSESYPEMRRVGTGTIVNLDN